MKEILKKEVKEMIHDKKLLKRLEEIEIRTVEELCNHSRMELSQKGLENLYINDIIITLELNGIDLKPNHAKKNHLVME